MRFHIDAVTALRSRALEGRGFSRCGLLRWEMAIDLKPSRCSRPVEKVCQGLAETLGTLGYCCIGKYKVQKRGTIAYFMLI
jgi:hypothetical protein